MKKLYIIFIMCLCVPCFGGEMNKSLVDPVRVEQTRQLEQLDQLDQLDQLEQNLQSTVSSLKRAVKLIAVMQERINNNELIIEELMQDVGVNQEAIIHLYKYREL